MISPASSSPPPLAWILACIAAVCNGSFAMFAKLKRVEATNLDPVVFNLYLALGVAVSSQFIPLVGREPFVWSPYGFAAGALFVLAVVCSMIAVKLVGLSVAQGLWSTSAIVVAFAWGAGGPSEVSKPLASVPGSIVALALLICGGAGVVYCGEIAARVFGSAKQTSVHGQLESSLLDQDHENQSGSGGGDDAGEFKRGRTHSFGGNIARLSSGSFSGEEETQAGVLPSALLSRKAGDPGSTSTNGSTSTSRPAPIADSVEAEASKSTAGFISAIAVGAFGGSTLVPLAFSKKEAQGLGALPSFGLGAAVVGSLVTAVVYAVRRRRPVWHLSTCLVPGLLSGLVWNVGNVCTIIAMHNLHLPYGVGYPLYQCGFVFAGFWGIFVFREIKGPTIWVFFACCLLVVGGVIADGAFGPQPGLATKK